MTFRRAAEGHALLPVGSRLHVTELRQIGSGRYELRMRYAGFEDPVAIEGRIVGDHMPPPGDVRDAGWPGEVPPHDAPPPTGEPMNADRDTLAATLHEHGGGAGDPHHGGEALDSDRPGFDHLGVSDGGHHRAGDEAGQRHGDPREGAGDRGGEPAGPGAGVGVTVVLESTTPSPAAVGVMLKVEESPAVACRYHATPDLATAVQVTISEDTPGTSLAVAMQLATYRRILGGEPAAGLPGDHPGTGGTDPARDPLGDSLGGGTAPDHAGANLAAHQLVQERIAPHSPELASVVEKLLDDPHALNVTSSLRNPVVRDLVLRHIEELARGDALARYGGDLHQFLQDNPGRGRSTTRCRTGSTRSSSTASSSRGWGRTSPR